MRQTFCFNYQPIFLTGRCIAADTYTLKLFIFSLHNSSQLGTINISLTIFGKMMAVSLSDNIKLSCTTGWSNYSCQGIFLNLAVMRNNFMSGKFYCYNVAPRGGTVAATLAKVAGTSCAQKRKFCRPTNDRTNVLRLKFLCNHIPSFHPVYYFT